MARRRNLPRVERWAGFEFTVFTAARRRRLLPSLEAVRRGYSERHPETFPVANQTSVAALLSTGVDFSPLSDTVRRQLTPDPHPAFRSPPLTPRFNASAYSPGARHKTSVADAPHVGTIPRSATTVEVEIFETRHPISIGAARYPVGALTVTPISVSRPRRTLQPG